MLPSFLLLFSSAKQFIQKALVIIYVFCLRLFPKLAAFNHMFSGRRFWFEIHEFRLHGWEKVLFQKLSALSHGLCLRASSKAQKKSDMSRLSGNLYGSAACLLGA
jgi:hypothetical protein